ncbi:hypothetical protein JTB14_017331 [Gonioctena quinquepunctata]|nr:hypothetical protein JTB14_017331 [Gonioctena quinquepunctata]
MNSVVEALKVTMINLKKKRLWLYTIVIDRDINSKLAPDTKNFLKDLLVPKLMSKVGPSECAVMYQNNEPIGILQPYEESYRFLAVNGGPTLWI